MLKIFDVTKGSCQRETSLCRERAQMVVLVQTAVMVAGPLLASSSTA